MPNMNTYANITHASQVVDSNWLWGSAANDDGR